ncbi:hypothetical protein ACMYR3_00860 [Ampullimonas aquatilis]|uniref:hypothetical protein n=1 Tax=Ampullimonas aquatilis TaxID=1341549 RepID=UPI003C785F8B
MSQHLADLLPVGGTTLGIRTWLKSFSYTRRLLLGESGNPWESASQYLVYSSQAQGLLKPDVAVIEIGELFESWLKQHPDVATEMVGKRKLSYPLRKLLEQTGPRALLAEIIGAVLVQLRGQVPLVLSMPSARCWLYQASAMAGRELTEVDDGSVEDAAMYMADFLRAFSSFEVGGVLLDDTVQHDQSAKADLSLYRPIMNVVKHYRWSLAFRMNSDGLVENDALQEVDIFIGQQDLPPVGKAQGVDITPLLWEGVPLPELLPHQFYFVDVPKDAKPETVLEKLSTIRIEN